MIRTAPLQHAIRTLAAALLIALLLEGVGLRIWAERLEVGALRQIAQPVTQTWERVVTTLHLDAPRRFALALRERWSATLMPAATDLSDASVAPAATAAAEPPLPPPAKTVQRASSSRSGKAAKTLQTDTPLAETASPVQIALVGDSMMAVGLAPVLRRSATAAGDLRFIRAYRSGTGLGRPDVFNWPAKYPELIGAARPALVICAIGANDAQSFQIDRTVYAFGTPAWKQAYADRVRAFARLLTRDGARVLWIGMPVMRESGFSRRMATVNALVKEVLTEFPHITWIDPNPYIAGEDGSFQQYLRDQRGKLVRLRADDGIHLSEDGAAYLVPAITGWMQRQRKGV